MHLYGSHDDDDILTSFTDRYHLKMAIHHKIPALTVEMAEKIQNGANTTIQKW